MVFAWIALVMAVFVGTSIVREFYKGARARSLGTGENFGEAIVNLTLRNTRRYGGYLAHMGFVLLFIGFSGQAFTTDSEFDGGIGDTFQIRNFTVRVNGFEPVSGPNYTGDRANVSLYKNGSKIANMFPGRRNYNGSDGEQAVSEIAIRESLREDVYLVFQGPADSSGKKGAFHIYVNPLVAWVWIGGVVLGLGTIVALLPNKKSTPSRRRREESETDRAVKEGPLAKPIS